MGDFAGSLFETWDDFFGCELEDACDGCGVGGVGEVGGDGGDGCGVPVVGVEVGEEGAGVLFDGVDGVAGFVALFGESECFAEAGGGGFTAPELAGAKHGEDQVDAGFAGGLFAECVESAADGDVFDFAEPAVDVHEHVVEDIFVGSFVPAEVLVHFGGGEEGPDFLANGWKFGGVHGSDVGVLVKKLFESCDVAVGFCACHGWDHVVDEGGVGASFCLGSFAGVVDEEGVDEWEVSDCLVWVAFGGESCGFAGEPFHVAVFAHVDDGIGVEGVADPVVGA